MNYSEIIRAKAESSPEEEKRLLLLIAESIESGADIQNILATLENVIEEKEK